MDRGIRRVRAEKIAKKRFRRMYCGYHGTPEAWFYRVFSEKDQLAAWGKCRKSTKTYQCRCEWCLGKVNLKKTIADQNFLEQLEEAVEAGNDPGIPFHYVLDASSVGPYFGIHEWYGITLIPWPRAWNMSSRFHHPKLRIRCQGCL